MFCDYTGIIKIPTFDTGADTYLRPNILKKKKKQEIPPKTPFISSHFQQIKKNHLNVAGLGDGTGLTLDEQRSSIKVF